MDSVELFEHGKPLIELIELRSAIPEVDDDLSLDIASVVFVLELFPTLGAPDPFAGVLPSR
ncbi:hypothetical protein [Brevibacterium zhoupengii]|uniref:hypothetical protein n=1 Tax=Brevibacterium zhoupengii TaxID=2898795 RepID=UPI001E484D4F|nr:hypothetical protein [Brevibacterium zhoupengii]